MKISKISASGYNTWGQCQFKYWLSYGLNFVEESGPSASMGTMAHHVLEILARASKNKHLKNSKIWNVEYLWNIVFNHYSLKEPLIIAQIDKAKLKKVYKGMVEVISSPDSPICDTIIDTERYFNITFEEPEFKLKNPQGENKYLSVRGFIDRIDNVHNEPGIIRIIDWKSGSGKAFNSKDKHDKTPDDLRKDIQPRIYHYAAKQMFPHISTFLVSFIYFCDIGVVETIFTDEDLAETKNLLKARFKAIQANDEPARDLTWKCNVMCGYGPKKSGICDMVHDEIQELGYKHVGEKYVVLNLPKKGR